MLPSFICGKGRSHDVVEVITGVVEEGVALSKGLRTRFMDGVGGGDICMGGVGGGGDAIVTRLKRRRKFDIP